MKTKIVTIGKTESPESIEEKLAGACDNPLIVHIAEFSYLLQQVVRYINEQTALHEDRRFWIIWRRKKRYDSNWM